MPSRVIGHVTRSRDHCPCHPDAPVAWHDEPPPHRVGGAVGQCSATKFGVPCAWDRDEPDEITEARKRLPKHRPTDRDYFAEARRG